MSDHSGPVGFKQVLRHYGAKLWPASKASSSTPPAGALHPLSTASQSDRLLSRSPLWRLWTLLIIISVILLLGGAALGGRFGLVAGFGATLIFHAWVFLLSPRLSRHRAGRDRSGHIASPHELEGLDPWRLREASEDFLDQLERLQLSHAIAPGVRWSSPRLWVVDSDELFCFSTGYTLSHSHIVISQSLIEGLSYDEKLGLIAYEMTRIATGQTALATGARALSTLMEAPLRALDFLWRVLSLERVRRALRARRRGRISTAARPSRRFRNTAAPLLLRVSAWIAPASGVYDIDQWLAQNVLGRRTWSQALWNLDAMFAARPRWAVSASDLALESVHTSTRLGRSQDLQNLQAVPATKRRILALTDQFPP